MSHGCQVAFFHAGSSGRTRPRSGSTPSRRYATSWRSCQRTRAPRTRCPTTGRTGITARHVSGSWPGWCLGGCWSVARGRRSSSSSGYPACPPAPIHHRGRPSRWHRNRRCRLVWRSRFVSSPPLRSNRSPRPRDCAAAAARLLGLAEDRRRVGGAARHARWRAGNLWGARRDYPKRRGRRGVRVRDQPARWPGARSLGPSRDRAPDAAELRRLRRTMTSGGRSVSARPGRRQPSQTGPRCLPDPATGPGTRVGGSSPQRVRSEFLWARFWAPTTTGRRGSLSSVFRNRARQAGRL